MEMARWLDLQPDSTGIRRFDRAAGDKIYNTRFEGQRETLRIGPENQRKTRAQPLETGPKSQSCHIQVLMRPQEIATVSPDRVHPLCLNGARPTVVMPLTAGDDK